ncbi:MAG: efflux RND transporter permease subunit [Pseudomonadota bacterium]
MIRYFTAHPTAANLIMALMMAVGLAMLPHLLRETFPRVAPREVEIAIAHPGAAPEAVSGAICTQIEDALEGLRHLQELRCNAFEGRAVAVAEMRQGGDFARFTADVDAEITAVDDFPDTAEDAVIRQLGLVDLVAVVAVVAEGEHPLTELRALAEEVKQRMLRWGGIPQVELTGIADPEIRIDIEEEAARGLGLTLDEIAQAVSRQNVDLPLGEIAAADGSSLLRFPEEHRTIDDYRDLVIASTAAGGAVRLVNIAHIYRTVEDREVAAELNGQPAAILKITKSETEDTLRVMAALRAFLAEEAARLPPGVMLTITGDTAGVLDERLTLLVVNSAQGLALVFAAMWLFFGVRQAFWIAAGLPVSFLGALGAMAALGYSINMLTLVALLIVIGILMDDAIVIAEKIETKRAAGVPPADAAISGAMQVAPGVLASFATTAAVFGALSFLEGDLGEILRVIPVVMLLVLTVSLVEAFLVLPAHLCHGAPKRPEPQSGADRWLDGARQRVVAPVVRAAVAWRWLTLGITLLAFLASLAAVLGGALKFEAFPDLDGNQIEARLALPAGAPIEKTEEAMAQVLAGLDRVDQALSPRNPQSAPLVRHVVVTYGENTDIGGTGAHLATARVDLLDAETRGTTLDEILAAWRAQTPLTPPMHRLSLVEGVTGPAGRALAIRLAHDDLGSLGTAAAALSEWLTRYEGTHNVATDLVLGRPEHRITLREGAEALGLDARSVADQLRAGFLGVTADAIEVDGTTWDVELRLDDRDRDAMSDLMDFPVKTPAGALVALYAVADLEEARGAAVLRRIDGRPTATVTGDVDTALGNADEIVRDTTARFLPDLQARYPDILVEIDGQNAEAATAQASMAVGLAIGLLLVFLILSLQLRSYAEPLVVMAIIPFALIGAVAGHLVLGIAMSMPSILGAASLAGIVVNDSILLVHVIKEERANGTNVAEAAPKAAMARFRAIFLTSLTTVVGLAPLLFETSLQAQPLIPLVTSIASGLTATTLLILLVVPAFYAVLEDLGLTSSARAAGSAGLHPDQLPPQRWAQQRRGDSACLATQP